MAAFKLFMTILLLLSADVTIKIGGITENVRIYLINQWGRKRINFFAKPFTKWRN